MWHSRWSRRSRSCISDAWWPRGPRRPCGRARRCRRFTSAPRPPRDDAEGPVLSIEDIHTYYGDSYVLQGVSLEVRPRTAVALLGRNGMGKTTLIRSIIGFARPRQGRVLFEGRDITRLPSHQIAHLGIGLVPQGRRIFPSLTVLEHLSVAARADGAVGNEPWTLDRVFGLYPRVRERHAHRGSMLSGGEQQMLAIARALTTNPRLLLMDERSEEHTSELQSRENLVCRLLLEKKKKKNNNESRNTSIIV